MKRGAFQNMSGSGKSIFGRVSKRDKRSGIVSGTTSTTSNASRAGNTSFTSGTSNTKSSSKTATAGNTSGLDLTYAGNVGTKSANLGNEASRVKNTSGTSGTSSPLDLYGTGTGVTVNQSGVKKNDAENPLYSSTSGITGTGFTNTNVGGVSSSVGVSSISGTKKPTTESDLLYSANLPLSGATSSTLQSDAVSQGTSAKSPQKFDINGTLGVLPGTSGTTVGSVSDSGLTSVGNTYTSSKNYAVNAPSGASGVENVKSSSTSNEPTYADVLGQSGGGSSLSGTGNTGDGTTGGGTSVGNVASDESGSGASGSEMTYEEWQKYKLDKYKESAEQNYQNALAQAEREYDEALKKARFTYDVTNSDYGANAESLAKLGLTESGYSDYLKGQLYSELRSDARQAGLAKSYAESNAQSTRDSGILNEEMSYYDAMASRADTAQKQALQIYSDLFSGASSGTYTASDIEALGAKFGLSTEMIDDCVNASKNYEEKVNKENEAKKASNIAYIKALSNSVGNGTTKDEVIAEALRLGLTESDISDVIVKMDKANTLSESVKQSNIALINRMAKNIYDEDARSDLIEYASKLGLTQSDILDALNKINLNMGAESKKVVEDKDISELIDDIYKGRATIEDCTKMAEYHDLGLINDTQFENIRNAYSKMIDTSKTLFYDSVNGEYATLSDAMLIYGEVTADALCTDEVKAKVKETFEKLYTPERGLTLTTSGLEGRAKENKNFTVTIGKNKENLELGGQVTDSHIYQVALNVGSNTLFGYEHQLYVKADGKLFYVKQQGLWDGHFEAVMDYFF